MMIDGGYSDPFDPLNFSGAVPQLDTIVVTHVDHDHIGGVIGCLKREDLVNNLKHIYLRHVNLRISYFHDSKTLSH